MDERLRAAARISAAVQVGGATLVQALRDAAATEGAAPLVEEALLQSYLFAGYPAALNAIGAWRRVSGAQPPRPTSDDWDRFAERGAQVCGRVYGGQYERLRANIAALHPDMERWMLVEGYGKVLGRPGMDLAERELCIVALLAGQDAAPQLFSHLRGALNAGASEDDVAETLAIAAGVHGVERAAAAREVWESVQRSRSREA